MEFKQSTEVGLPNQFPEKVDNHNASKVIRLFKLTTRLFEVSDSFNLLAIGLLKDMMYLSLFFFLLKANMEC